MRLVPRKRSSARTPSSWARVFALALWIVGVCASTWASGSRHRDFLLPLPKVATAQKQEPRALVAYLRVGSLPAGARILVRARTGELVGSATPYGAQARQNPGIYTLPIPLSAIQDNAVVLQVELIRKGLQPRAPTRAEIQSVSLAYIPVTRAIPRK